MEARFAILLALAIAAPCHAQQVHKCRERGQVVYQSAPCASGQAEKVWDAAPAPEQSNAEQWRLYRIRKQLDSRYAADRSGGSAGIREKNSRIGSNTMIQRGNTPRRQAVRGLQT
ncbi:DUF4124 domain-containing protein [Xanthomonas perforans]|uniref:DUF4124 domain-containing protein n=1 Tax=Xanthomonas perforans TaxID=442694 RepID=UPI001F2E7927|nr:DUF4124 domain-containing protein [Xanthomonas perforans]MCF5965542.1 DUF4124 domain-containing protein [Xanthomonas perforans]